MIYIRPGTSADAASVLSLYDGAVAWLTATGRAGQWGTVPFSVQPQLVAQVSEAAASGAMRIAQTPGDPERSPAGAMWLDDAPPYAPPPDMPELYLHGLVVDRARSGQGIGRALLDYAVDEARRRGVPRVRLDCWAGGDQALVRYYERAGFTPAGRVTLGNGWPGVFLAREVPR